MSNPLARNRLDSEASPYLQQHADNPVNWQPWDDTALEAAREQNKPIFLSIGYSACHWCHVMEEESFADDTIAQQLNEQFVPIKVDREERPDLDSIYMTVCQLVTGRGGWPLSAWLTPEGKPFYVGTYFPPEPRGQMPGFGSLLDQISNSWADPEQRAEMESRADQWTDGARDQLESTPDTATEPDSDTLDDAVRAALRSADREYGGFGSDGPKFPQPGRIDLLLRVYARSGMTDALDVATTTLEGMATGGVYDQLGGGFHRYAVDREWTVPHFEKMLYDNASLPPLYLAAFQLTGRQQYADLVSETLGFVDRELTHPEGGFYSTLDARSGDKEGTFYVWTPSQVHEHLEETDAALFCDRYGVTDSGNFEAKTTVLTIATSVETLAETHGLSTDEVESRLAEAKATLCAARENRTRPPRDEKILAGWNGLMISAYAQAAQVLDATYLEQATEALAFIREQLWDAETGRLTRRYIDGDTQGTGYLEDYAFLARGAFDTYQASGELEHLAFALELVDTVVKAFWDADDGTIYFTPQDGEQLVARPQELDDRSTPSSLGVITDLLVVLDGFVPDTEYREIAVSVLETHGNRIRGNPLQHVSLTLAADRYAHGSAELTIAAEKIPDAWTDEIASRFLPGVVVARRPPTEEGLQTWLEHLGFETTPPVWADRSASGGEPTVYACQGFSCSPPETEIDAAVEWLAENR